MKQKHQSTEDNKKADDLAKRGSEEILEQDINLGSIKRCNKKFHKRIDTQKIQKLLGKYSQTNTGGKPT